MNKNNQLFGILIDWTNIYVNVSIVSAKKINKSISEVRWSDMTAVQVYNLHRALYGIYHLSTKFRDKQMKLFNAFLDSSSSKSDQTPGSIEYCHETNSIRVVCKDRRYVNFRSLRIVGKKEITALDFYNGYIKNVPTEAQNIAFTT